VSTIAIFGATGRTGKRLVAAALAAGHTVRALARDPSRVAEQPGLTVVEGSIADRELVDETFTDFAPDVVVHAAASYKNPDDWAEDCATNALGSANIAQATARVSSASVVL